MISLGIMMIVETILSKVYDAWLGELVGKVSDQVWNKLSGNPTKKAFKLALGTAIEQYKQYIDSLDKPGSLALMKPLLQKKNFLSRTVVARELTQLVHFNRSPNASLIGRCWKEAMDQPPSWCDFENEAKRFLEYFQIALKDTDVFRPVFDTKSLDALLDRNVDISDSLVRVEENLADIAQLIDTYGKMILDFAAAPANLRDKLRDRTSEIQEKTYNFVGRTFVFEAIDHFMDTNPKGYFTIKGDPGIGKSALAAYLVRTRHYPYHFNVRSEAINTMDLLLNNICAQLIITYKLNHVVWPSGATRDSSFFKQLLDEASTVKSADEKVVIIIDALDEIDTSNSLLYLPKNLPLNTYVIMTARRMEVNFFPDPGCAYGEFEIDKDNKKNQDDIREYVRHALGKPGIQTYIVKQGIDQENFVNFLAQRSEWNFMYLGYVLPEIERGAYADLKLDRLPQGLEKYYLDHLNRMRGRDKDAWLQYKKRVLATIVAYQEPISVDRLSQFSNIQDKGLIVEVLLEWAQFLPGKIISTQGYPQKKYYIYHSSFLEFLKKRDEVVYDIKQAHQNIKEAQWDELWEN